MKIAVLDVDGTLYPGTLGIQLLRTMVHNAACNREKAEDAFSAMERFRRGDIDHETMATLAYAAYAQAIVGMSKEELDRLALQTWEEERVHLFPFAGELVELLRRKAFTILLISGSPEEIIREVAAKLEIADWRGASFTTRDGAYTGEVIQQPGKLGMKSKILADFLQQRSFDVAASFAIGDSMADLTLFQALGKPLAFEPQADLLTLARDNQWTVANRHNIMEQVATLLSA